MIVRGDNLYVSEATEKGIVETPLGKYIENMRKRYVTFKIVRNPNVDNHLVMVNHANHVNKTKYDYTNLLLHQAIKYGWHKLTGRMLWVGRVGEKASNRFVCGEWLAYNWGMAKWWTASPGTCFTWIYKQK